MSPVEVADERGVTQRRQPILRLRVAHVLHSDSSGGGAVSISRMLRYFHSTQDQFMLAGRRGRVFQTCQELKIPYHQIPLESKARALTIGFGALLWRLKQLRPDVLIVHGQWGGPLGALAGRLAGVPRIVYVARWPSFYTSWDAFRVLRNYYAERLPCRLSDWTVTLSESNRYQYFIRNLVPEDRLLMIPNCIEQEDHPSPEAVREFRRKHGWKEEHLHVVSVGRLSDQKRVMWLIKGWPQVIRQYPQARLWIIGDGARREFLEQLSRRLGVTETCTFLGSVRQGIVPIAASDVVAMTSVYESRGNVAMEALLCGKPIVASNVDGVRDTVTDGLDGFLVRPGDIDAFAARLRQLLGDHGLRERMGCEGRRSIRQYDVPVVMCQYERLFESVRAGK